MKLVSFRGPGGDGYGVASEAGVVAASDALLARWPDLRTLIAQDGLQTLVEDARRPGARAVPTDQVALLPPIPQPGKIICIGKNYAAHAAESGDAAAAHPGFFIRFTDTIVAHGGALVRPAQSHQFDFEGELAVIIGRPGRYIRAEDALAHVCGYSCFMDGSIRDYQFGHSLAAGKNFPSTAGFGPFIVTASDVPDPSALEIRTYLCGQEVQHGYTRNMVFDVPRLIAYISSVTPLAPGDVIATGTPEGVGFARTPPLWMKPADTVEVEISGIGRLHNVVRDP